MRHVRYSQIMQIPVPGDVEVSLEISGRDVDTRAPLYCVTSWVINSLGHLRGTKIRACCGNSRTEWGSVWKGIIVSWNWKLKQVWVRFNCFSIECNGIFPHENFNRCKFHSAVTKSAGLKSLTSRREFEIDSSNNQSSNRNFETERYA